jgi:membrane dipeptidase
MPPIQRLSFPHLCRRDFVRGGLAAAVTAALIPTARGDEIQEAYRRAYAIDTLSIDGPKTDPEPAIAAGMTATVLDISIYPRDLASATAALKEWNTEFARPGSRYLKVRTAADLVEAKRTSRLGIILACQDASILGVPTWSVNTWNIKNLEMLHGLGLQVLQLTHNDRNGVGDSYQEKTNAGLSRLGEAVVEAMNGLRMMVDLSHCGDRTSLEAIALSSRPCAITHAACRTVFDTGRAKTDAIIRAVAEKGGYFGIFNMSLWLTDADQPSIDHLVDHIAHAIKVAGLDQVGFGSDGGLTPELNLERSLAGMTSYYERTKGIPGSERKPKHVLIPELVSPRRLERLATALGRRGYPASAVEKIVGGNFKRIYGEVCG